jgi:hypothetical protein
MDYIPPYDTFDRIALILNGQKRTAFVREAVEEELVLLEAATKRKTDAS